MDALGTLMNAVDSVSFACRVEWLVVDECDKLFEEGFYADLNRSFREQLAFTYKYTLA